MAWIYLAESTDSLSPWLPGSRREPIVRLIGTRGRSCSISCSEGFSQSDRFGITSERLGAVIFPFLLTQSMADRRARTSAWRALLGALRASEADLCLQLSNSLAIAHPESCSWKTSQLSLFGGSTRFYWDSMRWGMMHAGLLFQPEKWEPRTFEKGSGFLPTPTAVEYGTGGNGVRAGTQKQIISLSTRARRFIPTPRASDGAKGGPNQTQHGEPTLAALAVRLPTPCARDGKDGLTPKRHGRNSPSVAVAVAVAESGHPGYLNPRFVEVMMGYPIGWTVLSDWGTRLFRKRAAKRLKDSLASKEA
jgi:hypothetical protein